MLVENQFLVSFEEKIADLIKRGLDRKTAIALLSFKKLLPASYFSSLELSEILQLRLIIKDEETKDTLKKEMIARGKFSFWIDAFRQSIKEFSKKGEKDPLFEVIIEQLQENQNKEKDFVRTYLQMQEAIISNTFSRGLKEMEIFEGIALKYFQKSKDLSFEEWQRFLKEADSQFGEASLEHKEVVKKFRESINKAFLEAILKRELSVEEWVFAKEKFPQLESIDYDKVKI